VFASSENFKNCRKIIRQEKRLNQKSSETCGGSF